MKLSIWKSQTGVLHLDGPQAVHAPTTGVKCKYLCTRMHIFYRVAITSLKDQWPHKMLRPTDSCRIERTLKVYHWNHKIHTKIPRKGIERNYSATIIFNIKERSFKIVTNSLVITRTFDLTNENEIPSWFMAT